MMYAADAIRDPEGEVMFHCATCGVPMTRDDFDDMSLRVPDSWESRDEYCDRELLDGVSHVDCGMARLAG